MAAPAPPPAAAEGPLEAVVVAAAPTAEDADPAAMLADLYAQDEVAQVHTDQTAAESKQSHQPAVTAEDALDVLYQEDEAVAPVAAGAGPSPGDPSGASADDARLEPVSEQQQHDDQQPATSAPQAELTSAGTQATQQLPVALQQQQQQQQQGCVAPTPVCPPELPDFKVFENAVLLVDKPQSWTSFDVCNKLKQPLKRLRIDKIGHAGTLDPNATGLLIICTGVSS